MLGNPGAGGMASLQWSSINDAKDAYWNFLKDIVNSTPLDDISFDHGHMNKNTFTFD